MIRGRRGTRCSVRRGSEHGLTNFAFAKHREPPNELKAPLAFLREIGWGHFLFGITRVVTPSKRVGGWRGSSERDKHKSTSVSCSLFSGSFHTKLRGSAIACFRENPERGFNEERLAERHADGGRPC